MLGTIVRSRALARLAVGGLTLGLFALAALAVWSTTSTARTTSWVRDANQINEQWGHVFANMSLESETLADYLRAGGDLGRESLTSVLGSSEPTLAWLERHGEPADVTQASQIHDTYRAYTNTLGKVIAAGGRGDSEEMAAQAEQAAYSATSLRRQAAANLARRRQQTNEYLTRVDQNNHRLRVAGSVIVGVDLVLLLMSAFVLLSYQRRVERQAVESRHRALHDALTGIPNRLLLTDRMEQALRTAERYGESVGLLLLDLNRFKEINDTLGHHFGDLLLQEVANRLSGVIRSYDTVARLGGDEFAILLPRIDSDESAMEVADRVIDELLRPANLDGVVVDVSGSVGVSVYPTHSTNAAELLQHADIAMYTAKRGQLGIAMYDPRAAQHSSAQLAVLSELRRALANDELVLHYQPKARLNSGDISGVEALVRWRHPTRGLIPPADFIPVAEQSDLIHPLTTWVLAAALRQHHEWAREGLHLPVAVNVATRCLLDATFPARVGSVLNEYDVAPDQLTLEITETAVISDPARAADVLAQLRALGVRLAIDDFGTGYSSMSYLQTMPLNELKIDRRFTAGARNSAGDAAIVRAVLQLGHALDLEVVAEGVEDEDTHAMLGTMGCDTAQGYYLSRPVPAEEVRAWVVGRPTAAAEAVAAVS
jgi:diguanylate cyclase (GGDEF)-like protein